MTPAELRERRVRLGLTQSDLATRLGVARNTVARWERAELTMARPEVVELALSSLDVSPRQPPKVTPRAGLPRQLTSFVGREHEIAEVAHVMETSRLTTLTGAGGVGKTRLALKVVGEVERTRAEDLVVVELAPLASPALVPVVVAAALGMGQQTELDVLAEIIGNRPVLLLLDNCEHLLAACCELVDGLLRKCPAVRFLVTSREPLGIGGETVWRVPSLSVPDAREHHSPEHAARSESVQLFGERARAAAPAFALTAGNASAVARLCRRLDGIPLALELAAARVPVLSVDQLADRVDHALRLLITGSRVAPPRQQTLRATLEWSHRLLSEPEKVLFRRLSIFAGGWTLDAAESVCAGDGIQCDDVLELLARLVDKSLVVSDVRESAAARYRLLETVRQLGAEQLAMAGETARLRDCHLRWSLDEAEQANAKASEWHLWFPWFYRELDNLRSALDWAVERGNAGEGLRLVAAVATFFALGTFAGEGRTYLEALLALPDATAHAHPRAWCLMFLAQLTRISGGDTSLARSRAEEGLLLARAVGDPRLVHLALRLTGSIIGAQRDWETSASLFGEALALARAQGSGWEWEIGVSLHLLGWLRCIQGDLDRARALLEEADRALTPTGDPVFLASTYVYLADVMLRQGNAHEARAYARHSLKLSANVRSWPVLIRSLDHFVNLAAAEGQFERAVRLAGAVSAMRQLGGVSSIARPEVADDARKKLGATRAAAVWAEGRSLSLAEAVALCLSDVADSSPFPSTSSGLTARELEVLRLIASGKSNREIASTLVLSTRTVERHIENLYAKIGASGRAEATAYAVRQHLA